VIPSARDKKRLLRILKNVDTFGDIPIVSDNKWALRKLKQAWG